MKYTETTNQTKDVYWTLVKMVTYNLKVAHFVIFWCTIRVFGADLINMSYCYCLLIPMWILHCLKQGVFFLFVCSVYVQKHEDFLFLESFNIPLVITNQILFGGSYLKKNSMVIGILIFPFRIHFNSLFFWNCIQKFLLCNCW